MIKLIRLRRRLKIIKYFLLIASIFAFAFIFYEFSFPEKDLKDHKINQSDSKPANKPVSTTTQGYHLKINKTVFEGIASDLSPYQIFADTVSKIGTTSYKLSNVKGRYLLNNDRLKINAAYGFFDQATNFITLQNKVLLEYNDTKVTGDRIKVNISDKNAESEDKISLIYKNSEIRADSFTTEQSGSIIYLKGNVESALDISDF